MHPLKYAVSNLLCIVTEKAKPTEKLLYPKVLLGSFYL